MYLPCGYTESGEIKQTNIFMCSEDTALYVRKLRGGIDGLKRMLKDSPDEYLHIKMFELAEKRLKMTKCEADVVYNYVNAYTLTFDTHSKRFKDLKMDINGLGQRTIGAYTSTLIRKLISQGETEEADDLITMCSLEGKTCNGLSVGKHIYDESYGAFYLDDRFSDYEYLPVLLNCVYYDEFGIKQTSLFPCHILIVADRLYICPFSTHDSEFGVLAKLALTSTGKVVQEKVDKLALLEYPILNKKEFYRQFVKSEDADFGLSGYYSNLNILKYADIRKFRAIMQNFIYVILKSGQAGVVPMYNSAPMLSDVVSNGVLADFIDSKLDFEENCSSTFLDRAEELKSEWDSSRTDLHKLILTLDPIVRESLAQYKKRLLMYADCNRLWDIAPELEWVKSAHAKLSLKLPRVASASL